MECFNGLFVFTENVQGRSVICAMRDVLSEGFLCPCLSILLSTLLYSGLYLSVQVLYALTYSILSVFASGVL